MSDSFGRSFDVDVGVPPAALRGRQSIKIHFHGLDNESKQTKGRAVKSGTFQCFNREWEVELYPHGDSEASEGKASIYLHCMTSDAITISFSFAVKNANGECTSLTQQLLHTFDKGHYWGWPDFLSSSYILNRTNVLNHGTLTIELRMELNSNQTPNFIPKNPFGKCMSKLFNDEESSDVLFEVPSKDDPSLAVQFHAHSLVLRMCAPDLARLCSGCDKDTPVPIPDVDHEVFRELLRYIYGGKVDAVWEKDARKIIDAADKYHVTDLKVGAEAWYVSYCVFTVDNAIDELLYADAKSLPLLREAAMDFILENAEAVIKTNAFENILMTRDIAKEIMLALATANRNGDTDAEDKPFMSVDDLRMALSAQGLDIDGSRELLESRLKM